LLFGSLLGVFLEVGVPSVHKALKICGIAFVTVFGGWLLNQMTLGHGCPHEGRDRRLLGAAGCWIQRKLTIENAQGPTTIWSIRIWKLSLQVDPRHPHLVIEWPAASSMLWRFRIGYRWDSNAKAYIFPAMAFKKAGTSMTEYSNPSEDVILGSGQLPH